MPKPSADDRAAARQQRLRQAQSQIGEKAGKLGSSVREPRSGAARKLARMKPSRMRIFLWVLEATALLAVVEHLVRPLLRSDQEKQTAPKQVVIPHGDAASVPVEFGVPLPGLTAVDPAYYRPTEVELLIGNAAKARKKLGWEPKYDLARLIEDMMQSDVHLMKKENYLKEGGYETLNYFE